MSDDLRVRCDESKPVLDENIYRAKLIGIVIDKREKAGKGYVQFKWTFKILKDPATKEIVELSGVTPTTMTPGTKLFNWITSVNEGIKPDIGKDFDLSSLIGRQCRVGIKHDIRGDKTWAQIETLYVKEGITPPKEEKKANTAKIEDDDLVSGGSGGGTPPKIDDEFSGD